MTETKQLTSVWDAIESTPQEVANMRAPSTLMMRLSEVISVQNMTQAQAADFFGVTQPRISGLVRGKVNLFSLDALIDMAATAGMGPTVNNGNFDGNNPDIRFRSGAPRRKVSRRQLPDLQTGMQRRTPPMFPVITTGKTSSPESTTGLPAPPCGWFLLTPSLICLLAARMPLSRLAWAISPAWLTTGSSTLLARTSRPAGRLKRRLFMSCTGILV